MNNLTLVKSVERHPLCVDLDGTLVKTDTLVEAIIVLLRHNYLFVFLLPLWLLRGRLYFKFQVFRHAKLDPSCLPYNEEVMDLIHLESSNGRPIVLATASPYIFAESVGAYLELFTEVLSSDETTNLKGAAKADLLAKKYGEKGFDYAGDSPDDLAVWQAAYRSILVNASRKTKRKAKKVTSVKVQIDTRRGLLKLILKQVRAHQWAKNVLIFLPLILSYRFKDLSVWLASAHAFISFSLLSSSVYVVNDLLDLESDRSHPENKNRPFASGDLPLTWGLILAPSLLLGGMLLSSLLSLEFLILIVGYFVITTLYSFKLKQVVLADILILASLYSWRVLAGAVACNIEMSEWFIIFAIFFFLSLALVKRSSELILMEKVKKRNSRRGYIISDLPLLVSFGVASGYLSVLVLALYLSTPEFVAHNQHPRVLWGALPVILYWISRIWIKAHRGEMPSDPLVFALKDRLSYAIIIIIGGLWLVARGQI